MKKNTLLLLLTMLFAGFTAQANIVMLNVDKAANIEVSTRQGRGDVLALVDGFNRLELDASESPLFIQPNPGATITSVRINEERDAQKYGLNWLVDFSSANSIKVDVVTSDSGQQTTPTVQFNLITQGEGITVPDNSFAFDYKDGDLWKTVEKNSWGMYSAPSGADMRIIPNAGYEVASLKVQSTGAAIEGTTEDGAFLFKNTIPDYDGAILTLRAASNAIRFSITADYAKNLSAVLEYRESDKGAQTLTIGRTKTDFTILEEANPLVFTPVEGGKIIKVTNNGETVNPIGWEGSGGYQIIVENGDNFVVETEGPACEVTVQAVEGGTGLDSFYFTRRDGTVEKLTGTEATLSGKQGEKITVSPRPGTAFKYLFGSNGMETNPSDDTENWFRIVPGANGTSPALVMVSGERSVQGVTVDVDNAAAITLTDKGGRGNVITLADGVNTLSTSSFTNALSIKANDGYQLTEVTYNGDAVQPNGQGAYNVTASEGGYIQIRSRRSPVATTVNFAGDPAQFTLRVNGQQVESAASINVRTYDEITVAPAGGYDLLSLAVRESAAADVTKGEGNYTIYLKDATVNTVNVALTIVEKTPSEGNVIVVANGDESYIKFYETVYSDAEQRYIVVKVLENNTVNEVAKGNFVQVYLKTGAARYSYVRVNGKDVECSERSVYVKVDERTTIDVLSYVPCQVTGSSSIDDERHQVMGQMMFEVNGGEVSSFEATAGMTVKLLPKANNGYKFDHVELYYPGVIDGQGTRIEGETYTFTATDIAQENLLFKAVFTVDEEHPIFVVRGNNAWELDESGQVTTSPLGEVVILQADGTQKREFTGYAGDIAHLRVTVNSEEVANNYEVESYCLMRGFPNNRIPADYVIKAEDADDNGEIWVCAIVRKKGQGISGVEANGELAYEAATATLSAPARVEVYTLTGVKVLTSEAGNVSLEQLAEGLYIAVSGNKTLKFRK